MSDQPTIDAIHRDIATANTYRLEWQKTILTTAAALFAFTVTFRPELASVQHMWSMWLGWGGLAVCMFGGIVNMVGWEHFYKSYQDWDWTYRDSFPPGVGKLRGKQARRRINRWRRAGMYCQFAGFVVGVVGIAIFAGTNLDSPKRKKDDQTVEQMRQEQAPEAQALQAQAPQAPANDCTKGT
ncbi:hypothetical protein [Massilia sp. Mn16-1_5]|uniref:hypothetical protein n=1 Tax=Massilia sp. Mn16-1_5 TaxID=2079199 RepID=UPI00109E7472|nr:hypothetical protein [Massilia sp. Mn16-1_5]THC43189.1 hypothetical protein C2862_13150 [Massilia sp. Mn16-1_5]